MTGNIDHPFKPGTKVVRVLRERWGNNEPTYTEDEVAKVYKTGKFVLKSDVGGSNQQYAASKGYHGGNDWTGYSTARNGWNNTPNIKLHSDELKRMADTSRAVTRQKRLRDELAEQIKRVRPDGSTAHDGELLTIKAAVLALLPPKESTPA